MLNKQPRHADTDRQSDKSQTRGKANSKEEKNLIFDPDIFLNQAYFETLSNASQSDGANQKTTPSSPPQSNTTTQIRTTASMPKPSLQKRRYHTYYSGEHIASYDMFLSEDKTRLMIDCQDKRTVQSASIANGWPILFYAIEATVGRSIQYRKFRCRSQVGIYFKLEDHDTLYTMGQDFIVCLKQTLITMSKQIHKAKIYNHRHVHQWLSQPIKGMAESTRTKLPAYTALDIANLDWTLGSADTVSLNNSINIHSSDEKLLFTGAKPGNWPFLYEAIQNVIGPNFMLYKGKHKMTVQIFIRLDNEVSCLIPNQDFINAVKNELNHLTILKSSAAHRKARTLNAKYRFDLTPDSIAMIPMSLNSNQNLILQYSAPKGCKNWSLISKAIRKMLPLTNQIEITHLVNTCEITVFNNMQQKENFTELHIALLKSILTSMGYADLKTLQQPPHLISPQNNPGLFFSADFNAKAPDAHTTNQSMIYAGTPVQVDTICYEGQTQFKVQHKK